MSRRLSRIFFLVLMCIFSCGLIVEGALPPKIGQGNYHNSRFDYQLAFPDMFERSMPEADESGVEMATNDGQYKLGVRGRFNTEGATGHSLLAKVKENVSRIIDSSSTDTSYTISYTGGGGIDGVESVFSEYAVVDKDRVASYLFIYPLTDHDRLKGQATITLQPLISYQRLIWAIGFSQMLHYDAFDKDNGPDEKTINQILSYLVSEGDYRKTGAVEDGGVVYFSRGPESEGADTSGKNYYSPEALYKDYFFSGTYKYPAAGNIFVGGTQTGIAVYQISPGYRALVKMDRIEGQGDELQAGITLSYVPGRGKEEPLGKASVVLKKAPASYFGYVILSYTPHYDRFDDLKLD